MAKSIRSKRMRKLRAFKRIRYGEKELARLNKMLAKAAEDEKQNAVVTDAPITTIESTVETANMDVDSQEPSTSVKSKPQKYPCWLSHFKIKKLAKQERKRKRKETKRLKKEKKSAAKKNGKK